MERVMKEFMALVFLLLLPAKAKAKSKVPHG